MAAQCVETNRVKYLMANAYFGSGTFKIGLLKAAIPAVAAIQDYNFVADLLAACAEVTVSGYARKATAGDFTLTVTEDDTNNACYVTISADQVWASLGAGETVYGAFLMKFATNDADSPVLSVIELTAGILTNGGSFTLTFPTVDGVARTVNKIWDNVHA